MAGRPYNGDVMRLTGRAIAVMLPNCWKRQPKITNATCGINKLNFAPQYYKCFFSLIPSRLLTSSNELRRWGSAFAFVHSSKFSGNDQRVKILMLSVVNFCSWTLCVCYQIHHCGVLNAVPSPPSPRRHQLRSSLLGLAARVSTSIRWHRVATEILKQKRTIENDTLFWNRNSKFWNSSGLISTCHYKPI